MRKGPVSHCRPASSRLPAFLPILLLVLALTFAAALPVTAETSVPAATGSDDFGQYIVDHQDTLGPFFSKNAGDFFRLAMPVLLEVAGWMVFITMVVGWGLDVLMSRAYAFFYAPAFADWKRAITYATGSLFLSFIYTALMGISIVLLLGFSQALLLIGLAVTVLVLVALAAQIVWVLYLFRTSLGISILFYAVVLVVHLVAAFLIVEPIMGSRASPAITNYVDNVITPRLQSEAQATHKDLLAVTTGRDSVQGKVTQAQDEIAQAQGAQEVLAREIEQKKNSDIFALAQILKARARGELESARDQLAAFPQKYPGSPLEAQARAQLTAVDDQLAAAEALRKQQAANAAQAAAAARADLLARAAKGQATLSEMRQALIGKSRAQVSDLLGSPTETASDEWIYGRQMILNPLTSEVTGLEVYFSQGQVQGVDYHRGGY